MRKYFATKKEAIEAREARMRHTSEDLQVFRMPKGSRHHGMYAVCSYIEWLNTY